VCGGLLAEQKGITSMPTTGERLPLRFGSRRSADQGEGNMADERAKMLDQLVTGAAPDYYRDDGNGPRYYVYTWWHGDTPIYVGKGEGDRSLKLLTSRKYNSAERLYPRAMGRSDPHRRRLQHCPASGVRHRIRTDRPFQTALRWRHALQP
jgi:hypothetical protein